MTGWLQREAAANGPLFLLLAATFAAFSPSLGASFHLDDFSFLSDSVVTSPSGWWRVWRPLQTRPLTYFTFWLNYQLGGDSAFGYHAFNLGLHLIVVWLLFLAVGLIGCMMLGSGVDYSRPSQEEIMSWALK